MQISPHVQALQRQLLSAAAAGGPETEQVAERLAAALDAAARLAILDALSDAAGEITLDLAPGSVDLRLRGRDVEFVVTSPAEFESPGDSASAPTTSAPMAEADDTEDASTSRTTLRLPDALKARAEAAAAKEGVSLNTWLVRAIGAALVPATGETQSRSSSFSGWVR
ncbi:MULTISPECIES: toxin-antitoxin system HicB family antitoxin [unclassified Diaminobutyricimonas]|uniref:toxin-antitoxin system HicB family antitoxin n=1 Tax=unclassified Diaminobutyricimonas TaxID=2643261 RepID=UPI0012F4B12F|nr:MULTISPECIES: toxin-antitoxin system HicB family antitoxin [unclassified Diaminobutyricimonas]